VVTSAPSASPGRRSMHGLSRQLKLAALVTILCLVAAVLAARVAGRIFETHVESGSLATLRGAAELFDREERTEIEKLGATLDALLANDALRRAFVARDRARLLELAAPLFETMRDRDRITHWYFIEPEPDRTVFLRVHKPGMSGDRVERVTLQRAIETREIGAGKELGRTAFALRVVRPWIRDGAVIGYVELAEEVDRLLGAMSARTGDEYAFLVKKDARDERYWAEALGPRARTWNDRPDLLVVDATTLTDGAIDFKGDLEALPDDGVVLGHVDRGERALLRGLFPLRDAGGRKVGGLYVVRDFTASHTALRAGLDQTFLALLAVGLVLAGAIGALFHVYVFARLRATCRRLEARAAAEGLPLAGRGSLSDDEVTRLATVAELALDGLDGARPAPRSSGGDPT